MSVAANAKPLPGELAEKDRALILEPASPWHLEERADRCILSRSFASDNGPGLIAFEQFAPGPIFDLTIAAPDLSSSQNGAWTYMGMRADKPVVVVNLLEFDLPGYGDAAILSGAWINDPLSPSADGRALIGSGIDPKAAEMAERVVFQKSTRIVAFETDKMGAPLEALNSCALDLLHDWEVAPEDHHDYSPAVMPQSRTYFARLNNYLLRNGKLTGEGFLIRLAARIESDGTVAHCKYETLAAGKSEMPDICADISKMDFEPARSRDGAAFASVFTLSVRMTAHGAWNAGAHGERWGGE